MPLNPSRVVVERHYALLPPEGIPDSVLPGWEATRARVLTAPAMGAGFVQMLLEIDAGGGGAQRLAERVEGFLYVLEGDCVVGGGGRNHTLATGGFVYLVPGSAFTVRAHGVTRVLWIKKTYVPADGHTPREVVGREQDVSGEVYQGNPDLLLKKLLPDTPDYDMAMNIFTFQTGAALPVIETHVMEHGLYLFEGRGVYYLGNDWYEVRHGDFIWMGPYCPQSFVATGGAPARYIYYKDVNRDVEPRP
jgi:(S)-ureidoglycine aminohydrolase